MINLLEFTDFSIHLPKNGDDFAVSDSLHHPADSLVRDCILSLCVFLVSGCFIVKGVFCQKTNNSDQSGEVTLELFQNGLPGRFQYFGLRWEPRNS